ncbi:MAG: hypothetical protein JO166_19285 [Deltaproteobacteria bacterium]|nr:hypothetical protein [Deltaproteobacteria bacterium]
MPVINPSELKDSEKKILDLLPLGKYRSKLKADPYQRDKEGRLIMGRDDRPVKLTTKDGDEKWNLAWIILDSGHVGQRVLDSVSFSLRGRNRPAAMCVAAGVCSEDDTTFDAQPEHLNNTYWYITVHHEVSKGPGGVIPEAKREFDPRGCPCAVCKDAAGKKVFVRPKVGWNTFEKMSEADIEKFRDVDTPF